MVRGVASCALPRSTRARRCSQTSVRPRSDTPVDRLELVDNDRPRKAFEKALAYDDAVVVIVRSCHVDERIRERILVADGGQQPDVRGDEPFGAATPCPDDGLAARHRFREHDSERLVPAREDEGVALLKLVAYSLTGEQAEPFHSIGDA